MKKHKLFKIIFFFVLSFAFISCETVLDCITDKKPSLIYKELSTGRANVPYNDNITFEMKKAETKDYSITKASIDGNLPPGINYSVVDNSKVNLNGTPSKSGTYDFTVTIYVTRSAYNEDEQEDLCQRGSSQKYKIIVY